MRDFSQSHQPRSVRNATFSSTQTEEPSLATLSSDPSAHLSLLRRNNALQDEVQFWRSKYESLHQQAISAAEQGSAIMSEREDMLQRLETESSGGQFAKTPGSPANSERHSPQATSVAKHRQELRAAQVEIMHAKEEADMLRKSFSEKIDQSKQFQQLRKLIAVKNDQLKQLRLRLAQFEADDAVLAAGSE